MTLMTAKQLAHEINVSPATVYRLARVGDIPSIQIGGSVRFDLSAVLAAGTPTRRPREEWRSALRGAVTEK